ncbi:MAG: BatD family protein [Pseudomonadales bacterium]|nr:BatD family protein [Pseudomonadales bacterium]
MVKTLLNVFSVLLLAATSGVYAQNLSAFVDRTEVTSNEVINLTVRVGSQLGDAKPALSVLEKDFIPLRTVITNSYSDVNGTVQSWTDYKIALRAKSTGTFVIPALRVGGQTTTPITIQVGVASQNSGDSNNDIFLETTLSKTESYVQEQLLYTIKLYYSTGFDQGAQLSSPQVENSVVQQLGSDTSYQELIEGIRYNVTERRFVIFPQASGELTVPPVYFTATIGGGFNRLLSRNRSVREINLASVTHHAKVLPKPAAFPATATWLPSAELKIEESWSKPLDELSIGESITRNITISALGLSSSLLPSLDYSSLPGLKFYPDQPVREDTADSDGVRGSHSAGTALVASEAGEYELPAIEIPWWNTRTNTLQYATLPARTLRVIPGPASAPQTQAFQQIGMTPDGARFNPGSNAPSASVQGSALGRSWIIATLVFALAWLFSTVLWLRSRRQLTALGNLEALMPAKKENLLVRDLPAPAAAYKQLSGACKQNDLHNIRQSLLRWGQAYFDNKHIRTLEDLKHYCNNPTLTALFYGLEQALYGGAHGTAEFRSSQLLKEISDIQKGSRQKSRGQKSDYKLPPLYKIQAMDTRGSE